MQVSNVMVLCAFFAGAEVVVEVFHVERLAGVAGQMWGGGFVLEFFF